MAIYHDPAGVSPYAGNPAVAPVAAVRRVSWGAVFAGAVIALVVQLLLSMLGAGIGLSTLDPAQMESPAAKSFGIGAGVWWVVSSLISLFAGGWTAGRLAGVPRNTDAMLHGLLTWSLSTLISMYLLASLVSGVVGMAGNVIGGAANLAGRAVSAVAPTVADQVRQQASASGFDLGDVRNEALKTLRQTGKPGLQPQAIENRANRTVEEAKSSAQNAAQNPQASDAEFSSLFDRVFRQGQAIADQADRDALANVLVARTGVSKQEALATVQRWETQVQQAKTTFDQTRAQVEEQARAAADATASAASKAALWGFVALLIGAIAAAIGGRVGRPKTAVTAA